MFKEFDELVQEILNENLGLGPMQFAGQSSYVFIKNKKRERSKKKRSQQKKL